MTVDHDDARSAELVTRLGAVRARIADACAAAGREVAEITLVVVTKTYPAADVAALARLGVQDVGESRDQEARAKLDELRRTPAWHAYADTVRWHFVGRVQSRKAASIAGYASAVHSVDRAKVVTALADGRAASDRPLDVFLQISLDDDSERGGAPIDTVAALADAVAARPELHLRGVMAVPPLGADPDAAFARLADVSAHLRQAHPDATAISAGMSSDLEAALRHGSTHLRVGTALLGRRGPVIG